jgi:hypothetical protein
MAGSGMRPCMLCLKFGVRKYQQARRPAATRNSRDEGVASLRERFHTVAESVSFFLHGTKRSRVPLRPDRPERTPAMGRGSCHRNGRGLAAQAVSVVRPDFWYIW